MHTSGLLPRNTVRLSELVSCSRVITPFFDLARSNTVLHTCSYTMLAPSIHSHTSMHACMHSLQNTNRLSINSKQCEAEVSTRTPTTHPPHPHTSCVPAPTFVLLLLCNPLQLCNNSNTYIRSVGRAWHARLHTHTSTHASLLLRYHNCAITVEHTEGRMKLRLKFLRHFITAKLME